MLATKTKTKNLTKKGKGAECATRRTVETVKIMCGNWNAMNSVDAQKRQDGGRRTELIALKICRGGEVISVQKQKTKKQPSLLQHCNFASTAVKQQQQKQQKQQHNYKQRNAMNANASASANALELHKYSPFCRGTDQRKLAKKNWPQSKREHRTMRRSIRTFIKCCRTTH